MLYDDEYNKYAENSPEGYYDDEIEDDDEIPNPHWRTQYIQYVMKNDLKPNAFRKLVFRVWCKLKNTYYRWKYPKDDIPF